MKKFALEISFKLKKLMLASAAFLLCWLAAVAGEISFTGSTDKAEALYLPGEKMVFSVQLLDDGKPLAGKKLKWQRSGDDQKNAKGEAVSSSDKPLVIETALETPGFVHIEVSAFAEDGKPLLDKKSNPVKFDGGAGVEMEKIKGYPEPKDFDAFWTTQKEKLAQVPMKVLEMKEIGSTNPKFNVYDVKVACAGKRPVSGYLTVPKDAKEKSLPAIVTFVGYLVCGSSPEFRSGAMTFKINAHGIENGREQGYYDELAKGDLKNYAFNAEENKNPETCYFNGMTLRVMRALEFVKSRLEWNGRDLAVDGGSQAGFQSLAAAGLDKDVTKCDVLVPWCCDLGGVNFGRLQGWRPAWTEALGYYDPANHAKRIKCEVSIVAGLGDYVCPPSGVAVLYNNIKAPKSITFKQGWTHGGRMPNCQQFTLESK